MLMLIFGAFLYGFGKAVADRVQHYDLWEDSIYDRHDVNSFYGPKDHTWIRKYRYASNRFLNFLFTALLVWTTDLWHFANAVSVAGICISIASYEGQLINIFLFWIVKSLTFNYVYHIFTVHKFR